MRGLDQRSAVARARLVARTATDLAARCAVELPDDLALWSLAGGRDRIGGLPDAGPGDAACVPAGPTAEAASEAAWSLVAAMEAGLTADERRLGAHYTPREVARRVADLALPDPPLEGPVVDPACGAGALLLAAAERLVGLGGGRAEVARDLLVGADLDPLAVATAEAAIALWSGGVAPAPGHLVVGDTLHRGSAVWPSRPPEGFAAVVGNPPFQAQLARATARSTAEADRIRERFGTAVGPYVDTAAIFLLVALGLAAPGARIAMVQPQSTVAARDAGPVRAELARRARLVEIWAPSERLFAARVHVCVPVLEVGEGDGRSSWSSEVAVARGIPVVDLSAQSGAAPEHLGDRGRVLASFRDHYYGLVDHVSDAAPKVVHDERHPLITAGSLGIGRCTWGTEPVRFAKRSWQRPVVDVDAVRASSRRLDGWLEVVLAPKVVVATQTKVIEAAPDRLGRWVPSTPTISVVPEDPADLLAIVAALCSPPASAWMATRAAGTALSADTIRVTRTLLEAMPLPTDQVAWDEATEALAAGDRSAFARAATAMHRLGRTDAEEVLAWWWPRARSAWPGEAALR